MHRRASLRQQMSLLGLAILVGLGGCEKDCEQPFVPECPECPDCPEIQETTLFGSVVVSDQAELEELTGITRITGTLTIDGLDDPTSIQSLSGLDSLQSVGFLRIRNTALVDFQGLENLKSIESRFWVSANGVLASLAGVDSLQSVADIKLENNPHLSSISALRRAEGIESIDLDGLDEITTWTDSIT